MARKRATIAVNLKVIIVLVLQRVIVAKQAMFLDLERVEALQKIVKSMIVVRVKLITKKMTQNLMMTQHLMAINHKLNYSLF